MAKNKVEKAAKLLRKAAKAYDEVPRHFKTKNQPFSLGQLSSGMLIREAEQLEQNVYACKENLDQI